MPGKVDEQPLLLDIYRSKLSASKRPAVVFIHGGGWQSGSKDKPPSLVVDLARDVDADRLHFRRRNDLRRRQDRLALRFDVKRDKRVIEHAEPVAS